MSFDRIKGDVPFQLKPMIASPDTGLLKIRAITVGNNNGNELSIAETP
ncbi:hypothetical protein [Granulibacter bethesdensis]|nr:hypothetical protein [Granulibacter bethesdensis]